MGHAARSVRLFAASVQLVAVSALGVLCVQFVVIGVTVPVTVWVLLGSTFPSDSESVAQDRLPTRLLIVEGGDSDSVSWVLPLEDFFLSWWWLITFSQSE